MLIRENDEVLVIRGVDKGTKGKVLNVDREANRVIVEGVNKAYKHVKRSSKNPQGGRLSKEMAISISNVMLICPQTGQAYPSGCAIPERRQQRAICQEEWRIAGRDCTSQGALRAKLKVILILAARM